MPLFIDTEAITTETLGPFADWDGAGEAMTELMGRSDLMSASVREEPGPEPLSMAGGGGGGEDERQPRADQETRHR